MKTLFIAAAVVATLGVALPAAAKSSVRGYDQADTRRIEQRIDWGSRSGALTRSETRDLERRLADLRETERRARRDGFVDRREAQDLQRRSQQLEARLEAQIRDHDGRGGHGYGGDGGHHR